LLETLGEDSFVELQKGYHKREQNYVVLKTFKKLDQCSIQQIILEDNLLQKVKSISTQHPATKNHFIKYYGAFKDPQRVHQNAIVLEMESGICTLEDILSVGKEFHFPEFLQIIRGLIKCLALLQKNGIANRDIKPQNIILVEDENYEGQFFYKVSDFGISYHLSENCDLISCFEINGFSKAYTAPEVIEMSNHPKYAQYYNPYIADVYSLGILSLKMIKHSFVKSGLFSKNYLPAEYEPFLCVLEEMLQEDHKKRMDFIMLNAFLEEKLKSGEFNNIEFQFQKQKNNERTQFFYELWLEKKELKAGKTIEGLHALYEEHKKLYQSYDENISRLKQAFKHLTKASEIFYKLKKSRLEVLNTKKNSKNYVIEKLSKNSLYHKDLVEKENSEEIYCLNSLGVIHQKFGDLKKCEKYLCEALKKCENNEHNTFRNKKDFARTFNNFGCLYDNMGDFPKAEDFYLKSLRIRLDLFGKNHSCTATSYNNLGLLYDNMGNLAKAEKFHLKSLKIYMNLFGEKHADTAISYNNLGLLYVNMENFPKSEKFHLKSLKIYLDLFGEKHSDTAISYNNLGDLYDNMGNVSKAEEFYNKSLKIRLDLFGEKHSDTAISYNSLGVLYYNMGNFQKAEEFYLKSLKIYLDLFGEKHSDTATSYNNLGGLYKNMGYFSKAEEFHHKSLKIRLELFGENHSSTATSYNNLGNLYEHMLNLPKTLECISKAYEIAFNLYGDNHPTTKQHLNHLNCLKNNNNDLLTNL